MIHIQTHTGLKAFVKKPGSKSITHRAVIAAALAKGESLLENHLECEDTLHTRAVLQELGALSFEGETGPYVQYTYAWSIVYHSL